MDIPVELNPPPSTSTGPIYDVVARDENDGEQNTVVVVNIGLEAGQRKQVSCHLCMCLLSMTILCVFIEFR